MLEDGSYHDVDSSDMAFQICGRNCFRETFLQAKPVLLEPIMKMEIEVPTNYQGSVAGELTSRRGMIVSTEMQGVTSPSSKAKCRCPRPSATRPTCAA